MNRKYKFFYAALAGLAAGSILIGGTMAYLTDYDSAKNEFTVGKVEIEVTEPSWKPEDNTNIEPTKEIPKDPQITNTGTNDAYVYLEVSVPMQNVVTADASGNRGNAALTELFSFTPDAGWTQMDSYVKGTNKIYLFSYNQILKPEARTTALFRNMNFANVIEGQIDGKTFEVPIRAYAIQTANTGGGKATVPEQAKNAFSNYLNQNKGQAGQVTVQ